MGGCVVGVVPEVGGFVVVVVVVGGTVVVVVVVATGAVGVTELDGALALLEPTVLVAVTVKVKVLPTARPVNVQDAAMVTQVVPPGFAVTV